MVLLLVLVVMTLLSALLVEFAFSTMVDLRLAETFRDSTRSYYLAKGGIRVGRIILSEDTNAWDSRDELWGQRIDSYPVGEGIVSIAIEDLGGRLDINSLVDAQGRDAVRKMKLRFYRLFAILGLDDPEALTAALIDWIDVDDDPYRDPDTGATLGAEKDYYQHLDHPYAAKNGRLDSLEELSLIRGFTPEVIARVRPHLTVHGSDRVNVNTASVEVLMSLSEDPVISRENAETIVAMRTDHPFRSAEDLMRLNALPGLENLYREPFAIASLTYRISAWAAVGDGSRSVEAVVKKSGNRLLYLKVN